MPNRRINTYKEGFKLISVPFGDYAQKTVHRLEREGHTEKSICFAIWKEHQHLAANNQQDNFWGIFINVVRKWSWPKGDPRWEHYWKKKLELQKAKEEQEKLKQERQERTYREAYTDNLAGFVYFVQGESGGPIKIGFATDVEKRMKSLQTGYPDILKLLLAFPGNYELEKALHKQFNKYRLKGEWFKPVPVVLNKIKDLKILNKRVLLKHEKDKLDSYLK